MNVIQYMTNICNIMKTKGGFEVQVNTRDTSALLRRLNKPTIFIKMHINMLKNSYGINFEIFDTRLNRTTGNGTISNTKSMQEAIQSIMECYNHCGRPYAVIGKVFQGRQITNYLVADYNSVQKVISRDQLITLIEANSVVGATAPIFEGKKIIRLKFNDVQSITV